MQYVRYGKVWDANLEKGQIGLIEENHYRTLFENPKRCFDSNDVWLDIGANIGAFAIRAAEYVREVVAAEPEPDNIRCLERNIDLNGVTNIYVMSSAIVGGPSHTAQLAISNSYSSTHQLGTVRGRKTIPVPALNINEVIKDHGVNKIKIDCEGTEAEILEAMDFSGIEEIIFEYHFSLLKDTEWTRFYEIIHRLAAAGFVILKQPGQRTKTWRTIVWARKP